MKQVLRVSMAATLIACGLSMVTVALAYGSALPGRSGCGGHGPLREQVPDDSRSVAQTSAVSPLSQMPSGPVVVHEAVLTASDMASYDNFGSSVAFSGDTVLIGADSKTVDGQTPAGTAYVFTRSGTTWSQQAEIPDPDAANGDRFGAWVALSGDTALICAPNKTVGDQTRIGAVYVYTRSGTIWTQQAVLTASDATSGDGFGSSVALADGTALIGTPGHEVGGQFFAGAVYVFTQSGTDWSQQAEIGDPEPVEGDLFGSSVALDGDTALIGAPSSFAGGQSSAGAVYVFQGAGASWSQQARLVDPDGSTTEKFGSALALCGDTALVGALNTTVNGQPPKGAAFVYGGSGSTWTRQAVLTDPNIGGDDGFGAAVALSADAAVVGAPNTWDHNTVYPQYVGTAYLFAGSGTSWSAPTEMMAGDTRKQGDNYGSWAAIEGDTVLIGAEWKTIPTGLTQKCQAGSVYVEHRCAAPSVTISGADDTWHTSPVALTLDATIDAELSLGLFRYSLEGGTNWGLVPGDGLTRSLTVYSSGTASVVVQVTDSRSQEADAAATVKIDSIRPRVGVSGADALWHRHPVTLTFKPKAGPSGIASVDYRIGTGDWSSTALGSSGYQATISGEGTSSVRFRATSIAGMTSVVGSCQVKVDTCPPTPKASWPAIARSGHSASLLYLIADPRPGSPTATVTIKIKTAKGRLVKTLIERHIAVNKRLAATFVCGLPRGGYRFFVFARDAAGNVQTKVASNKLTVR